MAESSVSNDGLVAGRFYVVAHRGNSSVAPENTLPAFAAAELAGADVIETDLRMTSDGVVVLLHDESLERTTDFAGPAQECDAAALSLADAGSWFSPKFAGTGLPMLTDLVDWAVLRPAVRWLLEFKGHWTPEQIEPALGILRDAGMSRRSMVQTFHRDTLIALAAAAPDFRRAFLVKEINDPEELLEFLRETGTAACNPAAHLLQEHPKLLQILHSAGQLVFPWTVDDPARWAAVKDAGANGIITNRPDELLDWLKEQAGAAGAGCGG